jgi:predicted nucleic acid-binding protein
MPAKSRQAKALSFVDTNILLYAHDRQAGTKQAQSAALLTMLWENHTGILSSQILQEFFVNVVRKLKPPLAIPQAREIVRSYSSWVVHDTGPEQVVRASEIMELASFSFWDSLVIASAEKSGAALLYSEDLQHGQRIAGVLIQNPFISIA